MGIAENKADLTSANFCLEIRYKRDSEDPSRVFRTMSALIDSLQEIDRHLAESIDVNIEPVMILEDIETGSIKTWLTYVFKVVPDDALYNLNWKPIVGQYLVKAKWCMINFIEGKTTISNVNEIKPVIDEIQALAEHTNVRLMPPYSRIHPRDLLEGMQKISASLESLIPEDKVSYISSGNESAKFNLTFKIVPESIEDLLAKETLSSPNTLILKVKKPDYLGESMWDFRLGDRVIPATISDKEWLESFQARKVDIRPGDSIKAIVQISYKYDYDGELLSIRYDISKVIEVIPQPEQGRLL